MGYWPTLRVTEYGGVNTGRGGSRNSLPQVHFDGHHPSDQIEVKFDELK